MIKSSLSAIKERLIASVLTVAAVIAVTNVGEAAKPHQLLSETNPGFVFTSGEELNIGIDLQKPAGEVRWYIDGSYITDGMSLSCGTSGMRFGEHTVSAEVGFSEGMSEISEKFTIVPPSISETYIEDFENYFSNTGKLWKSEFLTYSARSGQICPQNTEKGISAAVIPADSETASLNIFTGNVHNRIKLGFDVLAAGSLNIELEDQNRRTETLSIGDISKDSWQSVEVIFDITGGIYSLYIDGKNMLNKRFFSDSISIIRLCVFSGRAVFDNIITEYHEPFMAEKLLYRSDGELSESSGGYIAEDADCAAVRFSRKVDAGSVAGNAALFRSDGTEISAWFHAEDNIVFAEPEIGFEIGESYRMVFGNKLSSGFSPIGGQTCVDFTVLNKTHNAELFQCDFNGGASERITSSAKPQHYFNSSYEDKIGGRGEDDYAYKILAKQKNSTSGNSSYTMNIAVPESDAEIITTEFDLFDGITSKLNAKGNQIPYISISSSDKTVLYMYNNKIEGIDWSNIGLSQYTDHLGKWLRMSLSIDRRNKTYDLYMDGIKICSGMSLGDTYIDNSTVQISLAYWYDAPGENCFIAVDNILCYEGEYTDPQMGLDVAAEGYSADDNADLITVPAFSTAADLYENIKPFLGCTLTIKDKNQNIVEEARELTATMITQLTSCRSNETKTYKIKVSNQVICDDFDSWTHSGIDFSGTGEGKLTSGTDSAWANWNTGKTGGMSVEGEDGRGNVIKLWTNDTNVSSVSGGDSVNLISYISSTDFVNFKPTAGHIWVISCDMKTDNLNSSAGVLGADGAICHFARFHGGRIGDSSRDYGKAYKNTWYNVTNVIDTESNTWTAYVDGVPAGSGTVEGSFTAPNQIRLSLDREAGVARTIWFDNFKFYDFEKTVDFDISAFLTDITSSRVDIKLGKGSLKNIITVSEGTTVAELKASLSSINGAVIGVSGNDSDIVTENTSITVTSANGFVTSEYKVSDYFGIVDFAFNDTAAEAGAYVSAGCEYLFETKPIMITAVYNNGVLVAMSAPGEDKASINEKGYLSNGVIIPKNTEWTDIKAYVWDNMGNICPKAKSISLTNHIKGICQLTIRNQF